MMLQSRKTPMITMKNTVVSSIVHLIVIALFLLAPIGSYGADAPDVSSFMDLKSSVKDLLQKVKEARSSVVLIIAFDDSAGSIGMGNGIFIDNEGRIITNESVLKDAYSAIVISESNKYTNVAILNRNESADIALLQVNAINEVPIEIGYKSEVELGERVIIIGKLSNLRTTVSEGLITAVSSIGDISDFIKIETTKGLLSYKYSKEGPIINMEGKVIGITINDAPGFEDELFPKDYYGEVLNAVGVQSIIDLVEVPHNIEQLQPYGKRIWFKWLLRKMGNYVVSAFIVLFNLGFVTTISIVFALTVLMLLLYLVFRKFRKNT